MSPPFRLRRALGAVLVPTLLSGLLPLGACASSKAPPAGAPTTPSSSLEPGDSSPLAKQRVTSSLSVEGIRFESGSDELSPGSSPSLDDLARAVGRGDEGPTAHVRVKVDPDPRACSGTSLAELRAKAIGAALVARGVPAKRVATVGLPRAPEGCTKVSASRSSVSVDLED